MNRELETSNRCASPTILLLTPMAHVKESLGSDRVYIEKRRQRMDTTTARGLVLATILPPALLAIVTPIAMVAGAISSLLMKSPQQSRLFRRGLVALFISVSTTFGWGFGYVVWAIGASHGHSTEYPTALALISFVHIAVHVVLLRWVFVTRDSL